ncbi:hypothetical protein PQG02_33770 (plasmid) [Nostoc sp. UHCC 0926]|uniref:hypothetical protein n=1 Tax=Nostoc sp. UHCC 0926 TaxID=3025190 RepID=UPI0023624FCF|nr:hypothetical protein [Nostoc sp. UHCC 0926]WDD36819.1 hypothetical protein PQG02_33770 [Nostoc sp. UHCC 0926]
MPIKHPVLLALLPLSILYVSTASVSALHSPRPTALALTKDNQKSPSIIFFLPKERPQTGVGWSITPIRNSQFAIPNSQFPIFLPTHKFACSEY